MRRFIRACLLVFALLLVLPHGFGSAQAQQTSPSATPTPAAPKSFLPPRASPTPEVAQPPSGPLARFYVWISQQQRQFLSTLAGSLREIKSGNALSAALVLIGFSFAYGVLHAAGPGHGKAIVSSYMLADGQTVRRGVQLAFLSGLVQALSAIALFTIVVLMLKGARGQIASTEAWLERASWAIVAMFGAWLLFRQVRALVTGRDAHGHDHAAHAHGHDHGHIGHDHKAHDHHGHDHHGHDHAHKHAGDDHKHHAHAHHDHHGHSHLPGAEAVAGEWSWRRAMALAFAVGIRPCTGAIGVLFVANGLGLMWAGVISTFMMALGTAITVSALAALAASSRDAAAKLAGTADNRWAARVQTTIGLLGALLVFVLGSAFFYYSLTAPTPF